MHDYQVMRICVKRYLDRLAAWKRDTDELQARLLESRARAELLSGVSYDKIGNSPNANADAIANAVIRNEELATMLADAINTLQDEYMEAWRFCNLGGEECRFRKTVWLYLVEQRQWDFVARRVCTSKRNAQRWFKQGIEEIYGFMPELSKRDAFPNAAPTDYTRY